MSNPIQDTEGVEEQQPKTLLQYVHGRDLMTWQATRCPGEMD